MPLVLGAVIVLVVMLSAVLSVDTAYYYPRMMTDQLFYYMKGLTFLHEGTTAARAAINAEPFTFAAMPGLIRVPFMAAFSDFDNQLLAIQVSNILLGVVLGAIAAYLASWVLPQKAHWIAVGFSYTTLLLNPIWVTNMLSPLADLPYALSSLGSIVVLDRLIRGTNAERESKSLKVLLLVLFVISFGCRFTAPVLLVYAWLVWRDQRKTRGVRPVVKPAVIIAVASCVLILGLLNMRTIVSGYLFQPVAFLNRADGTGLVLNTVALAVPAQIIPGFDLLYRRPPVVDILHPVFATNAFDTGLLLLGLSVTGCIAYGIWRMRIRFAPEIAYVLVPLPVLAAMIPSTPRYLLSYQPFFWMGMYAGAAGISRKLFPGFRWNARSISLSIGISSICVAAALYVRSARVTRDERVTTSSFSLGATRRHAAEVAHTYRSLRRFLESYRGRAPLLLAEGRATGQWKVIAGIDYYQPDSGVANLTRMRDIFMVASCQTRDLCAGFEAAVRTRQQRYQKYGPIQFEPIFSTSNDYSAARVYRVRAAR